MKKRAVTLLLCLVLVVLSLLRGFAASAAGIIPATNADFDVPCAAAILIDEDSGTVLYEKNADARRPIASITKVMTLLLAFEALEAGKIHLDDFVPVSEHAYHMGGSQIWLEPGEQMTLDDMLKAICISSANDAAVAVAEYVGGSETAFAEMMNVRAYELGMTNTHFVNACGLDEAGHLSTARDVALMSREMLLHHRGAGLLLDLDGHTARRRDPARQHQQAAQKLPRHHGAENRHHRQGGRLYLRQRRARRPAADCCCAGLCVGQGTLPGSQYAAGLRLCPL